MNTDQTESEREAFEAWFIDRYGYGCAWFRDEERYGESVAQNCWLAYQAGHRRAQEWRPMESAPTTGSQRILVLNCEGEPRLAWPSFDIACLGFKGWLPLPALPEVKHT